MTVEKTINIDMENNSVPLYINNQTFENKSRKLSIVLSNNQTPLDLSEYSEIKLHCSNCTTSFIIEDSISMANNIIIFYPQSDFTSLEGTIYCKIILKNQSATLFSPIFMIRNNGGLRKEF